MAHEKNLPGPNKPYRVLSNLTKVCQTLPNRYSTLPDLLNLTKPDRTLPSLTKPNQYLPNLTEPYQALPNLTKIY